MASMDGASGSLTANEEILERSISHAVHLERLKAGTVRRMLEVLNESEDSLAEQLVARLDRILEQGGYDSGPATTARLEAMLQEVGELRRRAYEAATGLLRDEMAGLALYESRWQAAVLAETLIVDLNVAAPTVEVLHAAVFSRPFEGALFEKWAAGMAPADLARIEGAVRMGVLEGQTTQQVVRALVGTRSAGYADGALEVSRRGAEAVARTAINHVVTQAREEVYRANADITTGVRWVSTLDGRTTLVCISRDGKVYPAGEGPRPPAHWRCRSGTAPVIDGVKLVGERPTVRDARDRRKREVDFRAQAKARAGARWAGMDEKERRAAVARERQRWARENIGSVPKGTSYEAWLRKQPAAFQDEVLGPARGKLFREGGLSVDRFTDSSGRTYTLDELRRAEADAFRLAAV